jgi:hypothetical protein
LLVIERGGVETGGEEVEEDAVGERAAAMLILLGAEALRALLAVFVAMDLDGRRGLPAAGADMVGSVAVLVVEPIVWLSNNGGFLEQDECCPVSADCDGLGVWGLGVCWVLFAMAGCWRQRS